MIALLAAIVIGVGRRAIESGRVARTRAELAVVAVALENYRSRHGDYPRTADGAVLVQALLGRLGPDGEPLRTAGRALIETARFSFARPFAPEVAVDPHGESAAVLLDPWRRPYRYRYKTPAAGWTNPAFVFFSLGPDGSETAGLLPGGFMDPAAAANADNISVSRDQ